MTEVGTYPFFELLGRIQPSLPFVQTVRRGFHPSARFYPFAEFSLRFPLLYLRRTTDELIVSQPFSSDSIDHRLKASRVIIFTSIKTESLFVKIPSQMEWVNINVSPSNCTFQETPEVLNAIGMNMSFDVSLCVVNNFVDILTIQVIVEGDKASVIRLLPASTDSLTAGGIV